MSQVPLSQLKPGMVLDADVAVKGRLLLPAGCVLAENHIALLERLGVESVCALPPCTQADLERAADWAGRFFAYVDHGDAVMGALFELAVLDTAQAMAGGFAPPEVDERLAAGNDHLRDLFLRGEGGPEEMVDHEQQVASFPDVYFRLREVLAKPSASARDIARVVGADAGLSAKLLKLVNSPLYGFAAAVDTVDRAVALVGERELTSLAVGISAVSYFKDIPPELMDMRRFWKHSLTCAVLAGLLAGRMPNQTRNQADGLTPDQCFTAGLLHDVGRLILFKKLPYASVAALQYARDQFYPLVEAERDVFGYDHGDVARVLLSRWKLPESLVEAVALHHDPMRAANPRKAALICLADNMANALGIAEGGRAVLPGLPGGAFAATGLDVAGLAEVARTARRQVADMAGVFL